MAIVNPFDLLGDDDTDPTELTGLHEKIIKKTKDEKEKAREELVKAREEAAKAKAIAEKNAKKNKKKGAYLEKTGWVPNNGGASRGYSRNDQNNWENSSGSGYGNNRNSNGYNNAVGDWVNNNGQHGGYRNREGGARYGKAPYQNYNNGNAGRNYDRTSQREVESQNGKGSGRIEETLEDGFVRPSRRHVSRQSPSLTGSEKFLESSTEQGTKTAVEEVLTEESLEVSKTENDTSILEEVKKDQVPASVEETEKKEKLPASEEQKARTAEEENKKMTLIEYEKIKEEKRKRLQALMTTEERKVHLDKEFESMQQLSLKCQKDANLHDEKMKKISGRTTDSQGVFPKKPSSQCSVGEKEEEAKRQEEEARRRQQLLKNVRNVLRTERYRRPRPQYDNENSGGQTGSDTAQSNGGSQGPQGLDNRPQSAGNGGQTSSDTLESNGNQGNGNRPQAGRAQSNRNQDYGNRRQSRQGSMPQREASAPSIESSKAFPPLKK